LIPLTEYVKEAISTTLPKPTHLVDTYCGSGLFGITLSSEFERVAGVEISSDSIKAAKVNAEMNGLGEKTEWLCGKAEDIFGGLPEKGFEGGKSCVVVDVSFLSLAFFYFLHPDLGLRARQVEPQSLRLQIGHIISP
jgi:tRNA (uracil-5-)-methyltransferase